MPTFDHLIPVLTELGLNKREIEIYLLLLQVGPSPASTLAQRTNMVRSTAQYSCQQLVKMNIVRMTKRGRVYIFAPESPQSLLQLLEDRKHDLSHLTERVHTVIPEIARLLSHQQPLPRIRFYEGREGVFEAYREVVDLAEEKSQILNFLHPMSLDEAKKFGLPEFFTELDNTIRKKSINVRMLSVPTEAGVFYSSQDEPDFQETRFLPLDIEELFAVEVFIVGDVMSSLSVEGEKIFCYLIECRAVTAFYRQLFEYLWDQSAPAKKKSQKKSKK
jgi:sugar-specific transcriptional regulator TrmB